MTFDEHTNGQLRIGAQGDQIPLLPMPDETIPESDGPELASPALEDTEWMRPPRTYRVGPRGENLGPVNAPQYRVWLESKQGSYWVPGRGTDEETVRKNLTRTQRARLRAIKEVRRAQ